jgi:hypothetical protein
MVQQATVLDERQDTPRRNYWDLLDGWFASDARDDLTPNTQIVFGALLHMANRRFFPATIDVDKPALAALAKVGRESVRRGIDRLVDANLIHVAVIPGRGRVRVGICYDALDGTTAVRAQGGPKRRAIRAQSVQSPKKENAPRRPSPQASTASRRQPQVTDSRKKPDCPSGQLRVPEVGRRPRDGDLCPKCHTHRLVTRFKTDVGSRTKQRFLACSGYSSGGCRGFTWNLGSTAYTPSQRVLAQALVGATDVPGRPPLVGGRFVANQRVQGDTPTADDANLPTDLADLFARFRYVPIDQLLDKLAHVDETLASHHRTQGSEKRDVLRDIRSCLSSDSTP